VNITASTGPVDLGLSESAQAAEAPLAGLPWIEDATQVAPQDARELSKLFFDRLAELEEGTHEYQYARNTLIELNLSLVRFAAARFRNRSGDMEDIIQVGTIGLIKAIDRFDLSREVEFTTFAVPYIVGEIKRFFRDTSWSVHVPRRLQELRIELSKATDELSRTLGRAPTTGELAEYLRLTPEEVVEGLVASNGYTANSLDVPVDENEDSGGGTYADRLGDIDPGRRAARHLPDARLPAALTCAGPAPPLAPHERLAASSCASSRDSGLMGRVRTRTPVASYTALVTAAAAPKMPISPRPLAPIGLRWGSFSSIR
jgi:RNA polymerase sigma-B factor